jgi:hypothetical protein
VLSRDFPDVTEKIHDKLRITGELGERKHYKCQEDTLHKQFAYKGRQLTAEYFWRIHPPTEILRLVHSSTGALTYRNSAQYHCDCIMQKGTQKFGRGGGDVLTADHSDCAF